MSTFNTSVGRATTVPRQQSPKRKREPVGSVPLADADQQGQGLFGFQPQPGGLFGRLFPDRFGGGTTSTTAPAPQTSRARRLTPVPASETSAGEFAAGFAGGGGVSGVGMTVFENLTDPEKAAILEIQRVSAAGNEILGRAQEPLQEFDVFGSELGQEAEASIRGTLADPEAISDRARDAAISAFTDRIIGSQTVAAQNLQENLAARGVSDSGLSFALAQAGAQTGARDIAAGTRDAFLQQELARSGREAEIQQLAASTLLGAGSLDLQAAGGISGLIAEETVPVVPFAEFAASAEFKALMEATDEEDFKRRTDDFIATFGLGALGLLFGQGVNKLV